MNECSCEGCILKTMEVKICFKDGKNRILNRISYFEQTDGVFHFSRNPEISGEELPIAHIIPNENIEEIIIKYENGDE